MNNFSNVFHFFLCVCSFGPSIYWQTGTAQIQRILFFTATLISLPWIWVLRKCNVIHDCAVKQHYISIDVWNNYFIFPLLASSFYRRILFHLILPPMILLHWFTEIHQVEFTCFFVQIEDLNSVCLSNWSF